MLELRHKHMRLAASLVLIGAGVLTAAPSEPSPDQLLRTIPLRFEQDASGHWTSRGAGFAFLFDRSATFLRVADRTVQLTFEGANTTASFNPSEPMTARTNYFIGHSFRSAEAFSRLGRKGVYPGVDVVFYGNGQHLEYDFNLAPGAEPSRIRMRFDGADSVSVNQRGEIVLKLGSGELIQQVPVVYQKRRSGEAVAVEAAYRIASDGTVRLALGQYNRAEALVIDPAILYTAYLGGTYADSALTITHDSKGFIYVGGYTYSTDFPAGGNVVQQFPPASASAPRVCWVMMLNPFATNKNNVILYSTYFGGELSSDLRALVVGANGLIYFGGVTLTPDLPLTSGAFQATLPNTNAVNIGFVTVIDPTQAGSAGLIYSSYYGGATATNEIQGIATQNGLIYIAGWTSTDDLPLAGNSYQASRAGGDDVFIAEIDPSQSGTNGLIYATYLGGTQEDIARSIAVDSAGIIYVTGLTVSPEFPTTLNSIAPSYLGGEDAFILKMNPSSGALVYSSFLGGSDLDIATKLYLEPSGHVAITGYTFSTNLPITPNAAQPINRGNGDAFILDLDLTKTGLSAVVYSTYYGGTDTDVSYDVRRDNNGLFYIAGYTLSPDLPVSAGALNSVSGQGGLDGFVAVIDPSHSLVYGSYITSPGYQAAYGVDYDAAGNVYVVGLASSNIFPPGNANKAQGNANYDGFLLVFSPTQTGAQAARIVGHSAEQALRHPLEAR
jgi:hypothetical protein